jgi:hypothetical protein
MDLWYGSRANVKNQIPTIAINEVSLFHREPNTLTLELHKWNKKTSLTKLTSWKDSWSKSSSITKS